MASTKTLAERIAETKAKKEQAENHLKLLLNQQKEAERKARTHRLVERGAILESLLDGAEAMTNEQVKAILAAALGGGAATRAPLLPQRPAEGEDTAGEPNTTQGAGA